MLDKNHHMLRKPAPATFVTRMMTPVTLVTTKTMMVKPPKHLQPRIPSKATNAMMRRTQMSPMET